MDELDYVRINESEYDLERGKGKVAVLMYTGSADPKAVLDEAVRIYTNQNSYHEFIDINMDNPWTRVIMSDINGMRQRDFKRNDRM